MRMIAYIMRMIAYIFNLFLIGLGISFIIDVWGDFDLIYLPVIFFIACPIVNIILILRPTQTGWLGLYLQRKALEEKKKIEALNNVVRKDEQKQ